MRADFWLSRERIHWNLIRTVVALTLFMNSNIPEAAAEICLTQSIDVDTVYEQGGVNQDDIDTTFDGLDGYVSSPKMEFDHPTVIGDDALALGFSSELNAGNSFEIYYQVDKADGDAAEYYSDALNKHGFDATYWDRNGNGQLDEHDFDTNFDGNVTLNSGDYSPLGFVVWLYIGDPGDPIGSGAGTLVHTAYSPIKPLVSTVYSFTVVAPAPFDHLVIESMPDENIAKPAIMEIVLNGVANSQFGLDFGNSNLCYQPSYMLL